MATPILSKPQQKKSLSAKKTPAKGLKNVLAQPYDNYWPLLKNDPDAQLENNLKSLLSTVTKPPSKKIPWNKLRKMSKEERSAAKKPIESCDNEIDTKSAIFRKSVIFGINSITRSLEKNEICCILLDANVDPQILIKHIVLMARDKNIPTLLLPFLKKLTLETIEFASVAMALKDHVQKSPENSFHSLFKQISELAEEFSTCEVPLYNIKKIYSSDDESNDEKNLKTIKKSTKKETILSSDTYLFRESEKARTFIPPTFCKDDQNSQLSNSDFIPLGNDKYFTDSTEVPSRFFHKVNSKSKKAKNHNNKILDKTEKKYKGKIKYKPLKVKRLQGNEFRTKATKPPKLKKNTNV